MDKHYWIALYTDGTYDELFNTMQGVLDWLKENRPYKILKRLVLDD